MGTKRLVVARALCVHGLCHQLLAGAAFALYEHGHIGARNLGNHLAQRFRMGALSPIITGPLPRAVTAAEPLFLGLQLTLLDRATDHQVPAHQDSPV
jgi:hypothetical protein